MPPAIDPAPPQDITESEEYQEEGAQIDREVADGELRPRTEENPFSPSHYGS